MEHKSLRDAFTGLPIFFEVARERSFTKAAARLGMSQTAVSHAVRTLETRLGARLLVRNSRTVTPTEAGEQLLRTVAPEMAMIDGELEAMNDLRDSPTGTIRITASDHAVRTVLMSKLKQFLPQYPGIKVELFTDNGFVDIVAERFDAGVRLGESLAQDMIAVRIAPDARFAVVASKAYLARHGAPQVPEDLLQHNCINIRLPTHGNLWPWEFSKEGRSLNLKVEGQLVFNTTFDILDAALAGLGVAYLPEELLAAHLQAGDLISLLDDWCPVWPGLHLYYPSRRQPSGAMALLIGALRLD
ncbi:LysR family transcriptional regulator [Pseudomonas guariconensis]|uniref:LysR family transcriptional regulator n=1 Tax=Pseudomonas TaxID=286 RepID=UPI001CE40818|nr:MULTISPECIES: LysR family transcriptional regulator [Pseudomonas]MCO7640256.1 LysR family transcriptional regulator [Pseudomonas sp. S 311-6]MCO7515986.1 LysR family transcriptional regulator [Pseudomonas putida]MCO7565552.1 LysR family transcriptional regulator [Pseudomonas mosselii]MCO7593232.1 LysR family transcriptional regulator [Pseudomonas guariconensis]MCO7606415.1 LysR family transcriptional regulator [Pseudomonas guariconensis]